MSVSMRRGRPKSHRFPSLPSSPSEGPTLPSPPPVRKRRLRRRGRRSGVGRHKERKLTIHVPESEQESPQPLSTFSLLHEPWTPVSPIPALPSVVAWSGPSPGVELRNDMKGLLPSVHPLQNSFAPGPSTAFTTRGRLPSIPFARRDSFTPPRFSPMLPCPADLPETKPFPLEVPVPTAAQLGTPRAYNAEYPHPLSVYASPAVNPATVCDSGYAPLLAKLDKRTMLGSIISDCGKDISAPGLMLDPGSKEGCGIPEQYWLRLSAWAGVKVPLGAIVPCVRSRRFSLSMDMQHSRSETDLQSHRSLGPGMGPRRASLPDLHCSLPPAESPTRRHMSSDPPHSLRRGSVPFNVLSPVDEADDEVLLPRKTPIAPIGSERALFNTSTESTDVDSNSRNHTYTSLAELVTTPHDTYTPFTGTTPSLKSYPHSVASNSSEPTGFEGWGDEQLHEFVTANARRFASMPSREPVKRLTEEVYRPKPEVYRQPERSYEQAKFVHTPRSYPYDHKSLERSTPQAYHTHTLPPPDSHEGRHISNSFSSQSTLCASPVKASFEAELKSQEISDFEAYYNATLPFDLKPGGVNNSSKPQHRHKAESYYDYTPFYDLKPQRSDDKFSDRPSPREGKHTYEHADFTPRVTAERHHRVPSQEPLRCLSSATPRPQETPVMSRNRYAPPTAF